MLVGTVGSGLHIFKELPREIDQIGPLAVRFVNGGQSLARLPEVLLQ